MQSERPTTAPSGESSIPRPPNVIIVLLRRPRRNNPDEQRSDPFYEFGSFGCTGCHSSNLLHPKGAKTLEGARLAFAQGGEGGFRLVLLTPPVRVRRRGPLVEATWRPAHEPFKYSSAPVLAHGRTRTDFPQLMREIRAARRSTAEGKFASTFRSRRRPLRPEIGEELCLIYENSRQAAFVEDLATHYWETLPYAPRRPDTDRHATLKALRASAAHSNGARAAVTTACGICRGIE